MNISIPRPPEKRLAVRVTPAAQRALRQGHPWVFDQAIRSVSAEGKAGDLAVIFDEYRRFLAVGLYDPHSPIRIRVLQHGSPAVIDAAWLLGRLRAAGRVREPLAGTDTDGYRLVHGENDGLPGLVVDRYADTLVVKLYTTAWLPWLDLLLDGLSEVQPANTTVLRLSREVAAAGTELYGLTDGGTLRRRAARRPGPLPRERAGFRRGCGPRAEDRVFPRPAR